jgi:NAD(P)-dependent dehydrogenase (short-subunit alcohol dehydrogenase family)
LNKILKMKNYLIIGASSGIGKKLADMLANSGNEVYGTYCTKPIQNNTSGPEYHFCNVLEENLDFSFLPDTLDGLVYCPGKITLKPFGRIRPEEFVQDYTLQVVGAVKVIQAVLPKLKLSESASIVLFSTVAVKSGFNFHAMVSASKGAIEGLSISLAAELAPKIRVNCIAPSLTDTPLAESLLNNEAKREANAQRHPLKRIGNVNDIAEMAGFLISDKSGWITGQVFHVDGGISTLKI